MLTYVSILAKILALMSVASVVYLIIEFKRNLGFTKYLTRQDIDELYNYQWEDYELESLGEILIDRKKILKMIALFAAVAILSMSIVAVVNSAKVQKVGTVEDLLNAMYVTDVKDIGKNLESLDGAVSKKVMDKLNPDNIDNLQDRYITVSNPANKIRIINTATNGDNRYIEYQIINNGIIISNRRVNVSYSDGKINKFEEYILVPIDYVEENIDIPKDEDSQLEKSRKDTLEENLNLKDTSPNKDDKGSAEINEANNKNKENLQKNNEMQENTTSGAEVIDGDNLTQDDLFN